VIQLWGFCAQEHLQPADNADVTRKVFGNNLIRQRIPAGFGGEGTPAFQQFRKTMESEALFADTHRTILKGSRMARRTAADGAAGSQLRLFSRVWLL